MLMQIQVLIALSARWGAETTQPSGSVLRVGFIIVRPHRKGFSTGKWVPMTCLCPYNAKFVNDCITELVSGGCMGELETAPVVCSPLSVVENSMGKKRLAVNLRHLNMFLYKRKLKYEDLSCSYAAA